MLQRQPHEQARRHTQMHTHTHTERTRLRTMKVTRALLLVCVCECVCVWVSAMWQVFGCGCDCCCHMSPLIKHKITLGFLAASCRCSCSVTRQLPRGQSRHKLPAECGNMKCVRVSACVGALSSRNIRPEWLAAQA